MITLPYAALTAAAPTACPFQATQPTNIATIRNLPPGAAKLIGAMVDHGEAFQATDMLPAGKRPPFSRFVSAEGRGCDLVVKYERGGIAHTWRTTLLRFAAGRWALVSR